VLKTGYSEESVGGDKVYGDEVIELYGSALSFRAQRRVSIEKKYKYLVIECILHE